MKANNIIVKFNHIYTNLPHHDKNGVQMRKPISTTAIILKTSIFNKKGKVVATGIAKCNPTDIFVKETGRKLALDRAVGNHHFTKEERRIIYQLYFNRKDNK